MKKSFCILFSLFIFLAPSLKAQTPQNIPQKLNYYGQHFIELTEKRSSISEELKTEIKKVLRSFHVKKDGPDQIVDMCPFKSNCYKHTAVGYEAARIFLLGKYYLTQKGNEFYVRDVYCNKDYGPEDFPSDKQPGPGLIPANTVVNVEHTWPQSRFTRGYPTEDQKSDLHHLFPSDSSLNSTRGSFKFGEVTKDKQILKCSDAGSRYGYADGSTETIFEPPQGHKGNVARALFYFSIKYDLHIQPSEEKFLREWDKADPVDEDEIKRNDAIFEAQKSRNPFIDFPGLASSIETF